MRKKFTDRHKQVAHFLYNDREMNANRNITEKDIADLLGVSPSTVSRGITEAEYMCQVADLKSELAETKSELENTKTELANTKTALAHIVQQVQYLKVSYHK